MHIYYTSTNTSSENDYDISSLDAVDAAEGGDVVEREEVCVVGQPAHTEYHHQRDQHLHDLQGRKEKDSRGLGYKGGARLREL